MSLRPACFTYRVLNQLELQSETLYLRERQRERARAQILLRVERKKNPYSLLNRVWGVVQTSVATVERMENSQKKKKTKLKVELP